MPRRARVDREGGNSAHKASRRGAHQEEGIKEEAAETKGEDDAQRVNL